MKRQLAPVVAVALWLIAAVPAAAEDAAPEALATSPTAPSAEAAAAVAAPPTAPPAASGDGGCAVRVEAEKVVVVAKGFPAVPVALEGLSFADLRDLTDAPEDLADDLLADVEWPLVCFQARDGGPVFLALAATHTGTLHQGFVERDGRLWRLDVAPAAATPKVAPAEAAPAGPRAAVVVLREKRADFGGGVWAPDGRRWTYSGARGLALYDPASGAVSLLTRAPKPDVDCWVDAPRLVDISPRWAADGATLWFTRGGFCGYEGDFEGHPWVLDVARKAARALRPVRTVAVGADGVVWYGDAACDLLDGVETGHSGVAFRSTDGGRSFRAVPVRWTLPAEPGADAPEEREEPAEMENAAADVFVDARDPKRVLVRSAICSDDARGDWGGDLYATRDGGATWVRLDLGGAVDEDRDEESGQGLDAIAVGPKGLDELTAWRGADAFQSSDGGRTWRGPRALPRPSGVPLAEKAPPARLGVERVHAVAADPTRPGVLYAATSDGLRRSKDGGATWKRVGP